MSALTCEFCGRISTNMEGWRQIFDRSMTVHDDEVQHMMCPKCHKKLIADNVGAIVDPEAEFDAIRESMEDDDPARDFIGLKLRDFLCSGMYLHTQNILFVDRNGNDIKDYMPCMDDAVIAIEKPDDKGRRFVTVDYESM